MMPNIIEAPEFIMEERGDQVVIERPRKPWTKRFRAALRRALGALVSRDDARYRTSPETAMDALARQNPYLYIRALCG